MGSSAVHSLSSSSPKFWGLGLDWRARFVFFVIFFVIFAAPRIFGERGLVYRARINDYAGFDDGLEIGWVRFEGLKSLSSKELRGKYWKQTGCGRKWDRAAVRDSRAGRG
jgi:hypothetical protein